MFSCCNILTFPAAKVLLFLHINKYFLKKSLNEGDFYKKQALNKGDFT